MKNVNGLHHITAISGPAQENLDFYAGVLGMRLVKKSVNQDDTSVYHLFYADAEGHPGTDLTFFPWQDASPAKEGHGLANEVSLAVPPESLDWWATRLGDHGTTVGGVLSRFGEKTLVFRDPHGMQVALVESAEALEREFTPWAGSAVPVERQIRGLHGARLREKDLSATTSFLTDQLGFERVASEESDAGQWHRYSVGDGVSGHVIDLLEVPQEPRGAWGSGSIHHLAWRVEDEPHLMAVRQKVGEVAMPTPVIDRFWFRSVYFREPGGVLFELATDGPGFAVDEDPEHLGETLVLPPWLESQRTDIEAGLPALATKNLVETDSGE